MLIPIRTDAPIRYTPWANYGLIALCILVHLLISMSPRPEALLEALHLPGAEPTWYGFLTYQFLHADWWHLLGNMLFLWVFGNAVNAKMGNVAYLLFYLAGGIFAGLMFVLNNADPVIGASGSVSAVTAAFVVLYPRAQITIFYWFFFFGMLEVPGLILVAIFVVWDNILMTSPEVAYQAHLGGYAFGFVVSFLLLATSALPRDQFDLFALLQRWRRRKEFQEAMEAQARSMRVSLEQAAAKTAGPQGTGGVPLARPVTLVQPEPTPEEKALQELREKGALAAQNHQWTEAMRCYQDLILRDPAQALPKTAQLDVANQLMQAGQWAAATEAYVKYLTRYPKAENLAQVELVTGLVLCRYLNRDDDAEVWIKRALPRLHVGEERSLAEQLLKEIAQRKPGTPPPDQPPPSATLLPT